MVPWKPFRCPVTTESGLKAQMHKMCTDTQQTGSLGETASIKDSTFLLVF